MVRVEILEEFHHGGEVHPQAASEVASEGIVVRDGTVVRSITAADAMKAEGTSSTPKRSRQRAVTSAT